MLRYLPALTLLIFLGPVAAGPAGHAAARLRLSAGARRRGAHLEPWRRLAAAPGLSTALRLTVASGLLSTLLALALTIFVFAAGHGTRALTLVKRAMTPLLAVPHLATAVGLAFLIAPSGWLVRLVAPWPSGWQTPPDVALVQDRTGSRSPSGWWSRRPRSWSW